MVKADHSGWARQFDAGSQPWEQEVTGWVRSGAWSHQHRGDAATRLFADGNAPDDVVGFISMSAGFLDRDDAALSQAIALATRSRPHRRNLTTASIIFLGVTKEKQGHGYGTKILANLFSGLVDDFVSPRFVMLEVWMANPAHRLYARLGFVPLGPVAPRTIGWGVQAPGQLQTMVRDRFG